METSQIGMDIIETDVCLIIRLWGDTLYHTLFEIKVVTFQILSFYPRLN